MEEVTLFFLTFFFVLCLYEVLIVGRAKRSSKKKDKKKNKEPMEVTYLTRRYKLDMDKIPYNQLLQIVALTSSFDIAIIVSIILLIPNFILSMVVGFISTIVIILISYHLVYLFYKKKGMIKDES